MIYFLTIASPARSGTMWYSKVFTTETSFCYHELTQLIHPYPANLVVNDWLDSHAADHQFEQQQRRVFLQGYPDYFKRLWERTQYPEYKEFIVGNSDWMILPHLAGLWLLWPNMRFVFSARNGVRCVQSHFTYLDRFPRTHIALLKEKWQTVDPFEIACRLWASEVNLWQQAKEWLAKRKALWVETRFEYVTADLVELQRLWDWLGIGHWEQYRDRNQTMLSTPINSRSTTLDLTTVDNIWGAWTHKQRADFQKLCGSAMHQLKYKIPQR